ncbi:hypothetical protein M0R19_08955 [Candidatus Pacearchaeota archaeon]|nr:hypothetical protein [Candidatus Pacearchaeota archaeon]
MIEEGDKFYFYANKKVIYVILGLIGIAVIIVLASVFTKSIKNNIYEQIPICGDGSFPGTCSLTKPYYCDIDGKLVYNPTTCGCPGGFSKTNGFCNSNYEINSKEIPIQYFVGGGKTEISYEVYGGVDEYLYLQKQSIEYDYGEDFSRADFKINKMDEEIQREFLMPLVVYIQDSSNDKDEQARIAISLVQNIPFGASNKTYNFGNTKVNYSRYPYQVLYDNEGVCGEKTELLAFLLRELGFGVSFFYYPEENHEALGIKCSVEKSFGNTGYCFVETTAPSIISDSQINYADIGKLNSVPELYFISEGLSFGDENFYEYKDAKKIRKIRNSVEKRGWLGPLKKRSYNNLKEKYGLVDEYFSGCRNIY